MSSTTLYDIAFALYAFGVPLLTVIGIVFGILAACGKNKRIKDLGIWGFLTGINVLLSQATAFIGNLHKMGLVGFEFYESNTYTPFSALMGFGAWIVAVLALIFFWLYLKRTYGTDVAPLIASIMITLVSPFVTLVVRRFMIVDIRSGEEQINYVFMNMIITGALALICQMIFVVILFMNKTKEQDVPALWIFRSLIVLSLIITCVVTITFTKLSLDAGYDEMTKYDLIVKFVSLALAFILPATNFYLFSKSRKA